MGDSRTELLDTFLKLGYVLCLECRRPIPAKPSLRMASSDVGLEDKLGPLLQEDFYSAVPSVHDLLRRGIVTYDDVLPFFR